MNIVGFEPTLFRYLYSKGVHALEIDFIGRDCANVMCMNSYENCAIFTDRTDVQIIHSSLKKRLACIGNLGRGSNRIKQQTDTFFLKV